MKYKSPLEPKVSSIHFSQCIQRLAIRSRLMKCHEMSHDNTVINFTEAGHVMSIFTAIIVKKWITTTATATKFLHYA